MNPSAVRRAELGLRNPLVLALDLDNFNDALSIISEVGDLVGAIKLGPRLLLPRGEVICRAVTDVCPLFIDCKFHDIPATMVAAVQSAFNLGATLVTIHAQAGVDALREVANLESHFAGQRPFRVLAVTLLTSLNENNLPSTWKGQTPSSLVQSLFEEAISVGISGFVCSPHEASMLRSKDTSVFLLTPGVRPAGALQHDQRRTLSPREALDFGSDALVVGRPIIEASDRRETLKKILSDIAPHLSEASGKGRS